MSTSRLVDHIAKNCQVQCDLGTHSLGRREGRIESVSGLISSASLIHAQMLILATAASHETGPRWRGEGATSGVLEG